MAKSTHVNGVLRALWDDVKRVYTEWDETGQQTLSRVYTASENEAADAFAATSRANVNHAIITNQAQNALSNDRDYLALSSPTNAQVVAQVAALTRQNMAIIRLTLGQLESTD